MDAVKRNTKIKYEHIVIDNASSDGTKEWFAWMRKNTSWHDNVKYFRQERNTGDWGGMLIGATHSTGEYIVQLDNDIIPCEGWLQYMLYTLQNTSYRVVMLKRSNVFGKWILKPRTEIADIGGLMVGGIERPVACFMMRKADFDKINVPESQGAKSKYVIGRKLPTAKIMNKTCYELQATKGEIVANIDQRSKYSPQNGQIWQKV